MMHQERCGLRRKPAINSNTTGGQNVENLANTVLIEVFL